MTQPKFTIGTFNIRGEILQVFVDQGTRTTEIKIPVDKYMRWLLINEKRDAKITYHDGDQKKQIDCLMDQQEYWQQPDETIHQHILEYIGSNPIEHRGNQIQDAIANINQAFAEYEASKIAV